MANYTSDTSQAASAIGSSANPRAVQAAQAALAERLVRLIVDELAGIEDAMPSVADGGQVKLWVKSDTLEDLMRQVLTELKKMNTQLSLMTDEEIPDVDS